MTIQAAARHLAPAARRVPTASSVLSRSAGRHVPAATPSVFRRRAVATLACAGVVWSLGLAAEAAPLPAADDATQVGVTAPAPIEVTDLALTDVAVRDQQAAPNGSFGDPAVKPVGGSGVSTVANMAGNGGLPSLAGKPQSGIPEPVQVSTRDQVLAVARSLQGIPYVYGGTTPAGFDCSGFTSYVFRQVGVDLPRTSGEQAGVGYRVSAAEALPGDLMWRPGHVGIYTGNGMMIHSPHTGTVVKEVPVYSGDFAYIRVL